MKIAMIQVPVEEDIKKNISYVQSCIPQCKEADVIVLPEIWNCPYDNTCMKNSIEFQEEAKQVLQEVSKQCQAYVIGGTIAYQEGNNVYNRCLIYHKGTLVSSYSKMHLMTFHGRTTYTEKDVFTPGNQFTVIDSSFGKMGVVVCYDIRFPEETRILAKKGVQILFVPAAFNEQVGKAHWDILMRTRAMENEIFVVAVNPARYTHKGYTSYGHSMIVDPFGRIQYEMDEKSGVHVEEIDLHEIQKIRNRMPFWQVRRDDVYEVEEKI